MVLSGMCWGGVLQWLTGLDVPRKGLVEVAVALVRFLSVSAPFPAGPPLSLLLFQSIYTVLSNNGNMPPNNILKEQECAEACMPYGQYKNIILSFHL